MTQLEIPAALKSRRGAGPIWLVGWVMGVILLLALVFLMTRQDQAAASQQGAPPPSPSSAPAHAAAESTPREPSAPASAGAVLTATGYIVPRERVELGPKLPGTVTWMGVEKGDRVQKGQIIARLEDAEYRARFQEARGQLALAEAELKNAEVTHTRQVELTRTRIGTDQALDDAVRAVDVATAQVLIAQGQLALAQTHLDWCAIAAPLDGVVLEKYVDAEELVIPQAFGGKDNPSTLIVALADLKDLQIEIDLNELDTPKVFLKQRCRVQPEAYKDRVYEGYVREISPEADRNKGTLEVKVQIELPDEHLVPELNARVDFLPKPAE